MREVILFFRKNFFEVVGWLVDLILDLLFPKFCINCGRLLPITQKLCVCSSCRSTVRDMTSVLIDDTSGCEEIISALKYDGKIREAMLKFKFKNIKYLGYTFGKLLAEAVNEREFMNEDVLITYVPIHVSRDREYNQSAVIAEHMCSELGLKCFGGIIYRIKPIERLSSMKGYDKEFYIRNSYMFNPQINLSGKTVVIVDDVLTTGTTLRTISEELKKHGAKHVYALTACYSKTQ